MEEEDHFTQTLLPALIAALAALSFSLLSCTHSPHFLLSTLLSLSVPIYRQEWCHSSSSSSTKVAAHGLHHFINGWCNNHCSLLTMASLFLKVGCNCYCPLMAISQQSPPLIFIWAIVLLLLQHKLASCNSSKLIILRASVAKFTGTRQTFQSPELPKHTFSHTKGSQQLDGLPLHF